MQVRLREGKLGCHGERGFEPPATASPLGQTEASRPYLPKAAGHMQGISTALSVTSMLLDVEAVFLAIARHAEAAGEPAEGASFPHMHQSCRQRMR